MFEIQLLGQIDRFGAEDLGHRLCWLGVFEFSTYCGFSKFEGDE